MRRWLIAAGVAVVVLGGALAVAIIRLDRFLEAQRTRLAAEIEREIGRPVELGAAGVTLRGGPGVRIAGVRVPEDPEWGGGDLLRAREARVTVRVLPALRGRFEIRRVTLEGPVLSVIRDARGLNLDALRPRTERGRREGGSRRERDRSPMVVGLADVRDGEVLYEDRRHDPPLALTARHVEISASDVTSGRPVAIEASAAVLGAEEWNLEATGSVGPPGDPPEPGTTPVDLQWRLRGVDAAALAGAAAALDVTPPRDLIVAGPVTGRGRVRGPLDGVAVDATLDATQAALRLGSTFAKPPGASLTVELAAGRQADRITVDRGALRLGDASLEATGWVVPGEPPTANLRLDSNRAPLAVVANVMPAIAGSDAAGTLEAHLAVEGALRSQPLPTVSGTIALTDIRARRPGDQKGISDLTTTITVADGVARMPTTRFRLGEAQVEASAELGLAERVLTAGAKASELFGGTVEGTTRVELADAKRPHFTLTATARGVGLAPLVAMRAPPLAAHVEGRLDADVWLAGTGGGRRVVRQSLGGTAHIDVHDGMLRGVRIADEILGAVTGVEQMGRLVPARLRKKRPDLFEASDTRFEELRATARIADRRATTDDLVMRTDAYTVTGHGTVDFDGQVDLDAAFLAGPTLTADVLESVTDARWATNARGELEVPFHVAGRFPELRPKPDAEFLARTVGRALADRVRKAFRGESGKVQPGDGVDEAMRKLQQLLGR